MAGVIGLREIREKRGLSLEAVAYLAGVDQATVSRWERGLVTPRREAVVQLARALGVTIKRMTEPATGLAMRDLGYEVEEGES